MHFTPIALILPLYLSLVMAGSTPGESTASDVVPPQYLASGAADHAQNANKRAAEAKAQLDSFTRSYTGHTDPLEESAVLLNKASLEIEYAAGHTLETQERLKHNPVTGDYPEVGSAENHALDDPNAPKAHAGIAANHAAEAANLAKQAHTHLMTHANSLSLSEKDGANLEHPKQHLDAARQHLRHATRHNHRAMLSQELLDHKHKTDADPFHRDTGEDISIRKSLAEDYHRAWGRRHREVAGQLNAGLEQAYRDSQTGLDPLAGLRRANEYRGPMNVNKDLANHHERNADEAKAYQKKKREEKEKKGADGGGSKGKAKA